MAPQPTLSSGPGFIVFEKGCMAITNNMFWKVGYSYRWDDYDDLSSFHLKLSYAHSLNDNIRLGINLGYLKYQHYVKTVTVALERNTASSQSLTFDLGILFSNILKASTFASISLGI